MNNNKKFLHGNKARIKPDKDVIPRFTNYVVNDYITRDGTVMHRLDDDAEFTQSEVNQNQK
ncbi:MAG: hypothetical protein FWH08_06685 [Oscillospiraceae bacterium]|nr:hypothetical protein [Oscillospiraceae bacterium]